MQEKRKSEMLSDWDFDTEWSIDFDEDSRVSFLPESKGNF